MRTFEPLTKSRGCTRDVRFRGRIAEWMPLAGVPPVLQAMSYTHEKPREGISSFEDARGTQLVLLATRDVEIRVSYDVPFTQRASYAKGIWRALGRACERSLSG